MKYFAYGSNMDSEEMERVKVGFLLRTRAALKGWTLRFNKQADRNPKEEGYANIIQNDNDIVEGALYEISKKDLPKLDEKEKYYPSYPFNNPIHHYIRTEVVVRLDNSDEVTAKTYIANSNRVQEGLLPRKSYLRHLLEAEDILSESYYDKLNNWDTLEKKKNK